MIFIIQSAAQVYSTMPSSLKVFEKKHEKIHSCKYSEIRLGNEITLRLVQKEFGFAWFAMNLEFIIIIRVLFQEETDRIGGTPKKSRKSEVKNTTTSQWVSEFLIIYTF